MESSNVHPSAPGQEVQLPTGMSLAPLSHSVTLAEWSDGILLVALLPAG
jgi:hypothetical protein